MILGLDISTSKVGVALLNKDKTIVESFVVKMDSDTSLYLRAHQLKGVLEGLIDEYVIEKIYVEEPMINFSRASMAWTMAILQRFNGMASWVIYEVFEQEPILVNVNAARKKVGIHIERGKKHKSVREKKQPIIDFITESYAKTKTPFTYGLTRSGNPEVGTDDRADAIVVALQGML